MTIKAVMFDFGDTLVHTEGFDYDVCLQRIHQNLAKNGIAVPFNEFCRVYFEVRDRFYRETDKTLEEQDFAERIVQTLKPFGIELSREDKHVKEAVKVFMSAFVDSLRIDDNLPSLLEELHRKYKLAVVSNMSFAEAGFESLRKFGIAKHFDAIVISGAFGWRKPSPKIFRAALKALRAKAQETVFVGDSPIADIKGAKLLGIKTVLLTEKDKRIPSTDTFRLYIRQSADAPRPDITIVELAQLPEALECLVKET